MKKKQKVTLEQLANKMDKGFTDVYNKMDDMEIRIDKKIDDKIDVLAMAVKVGFDEVDDKFREVGEEFQQLNEKVDGYDKRHNVRLDNLERRQDKFAEKLGVLQRGIA